MKLVIRLAVRIAIIKHICIAITQTHITGLNVATMACQRRVHYLKRLLQWHALGELFLHQRPNLLCANGSWYASGQAHTFQEAIEHKGIRRTYIRLAISNVALMMRKRRAPSMYEQVMGWREVLDCVYLSPDRCHGALHLPYLMVVPPCHTPAIPLPALAMQASAVLTHLRKLHYEGLHIARCGCGKQ
jgi:hypothetical protein